MPINPMQAQSASMAAGGGMPQDNQAQPSMSMGGGQSAQVDEIINTLKQIFPQVIDERGYVNMDRLITMWPQFSKIPFQAVMQLIQQNPELLNELIAQYGIGGIIFQGRTISADELASLGGRGGTNA